MYTQGSDGMTQVHTADDIIQGNIGCSSDRPAEASRLDQQDRHGFVEILGNTWLWSLN